jgi:hypothetical protein
VDRVNRAQVFSFSANRVHVTTLQPHTSAALHLAQTLFLALSPTLSRELMATTDVSNVVKLFAAAFANFARVTREVGKKLKQNCVQLHRRL